MVGKAGFEPTTSWSQTMHTTGLYYFPYCRLTWNRTTNSCLEGDCYIHLTMSPTKHNHLTSSGVKSCRANCIYNLIVFAEWTRLELATSAVTGQHSNQLNYQSKFEPKVGIEPTTY